MAIPELLNDLIRLLLNLAPLAAVGCLVLAGISLRREGGTNFIIGGGFTKWMFWAAVFVTLPQTLSFLAAACGFTDVRVELRSPVDPAARLQAVPTDGLPPRAAEALNENIERLNGLLYGPQEYALLARR